MGLRRQIVLMRWGAWSIAAGLLVVGFWANDHFPLVLVPFVGLLAWAGWQGAGELVVKRAFRRFARALEAERIRESHALLVELRELYVGDARTQEHLRAHEANVLLAEDRAPEAAALLDSIDEKLLGAQALPWLRNNRAWAFAEIGEGARALELARASMDATGEGKELVGTTEDVRAYQLGTLGAALVVAGKSEEAIGVLEEAMARGGKPSAQSARGFYLGRAFHALGRDDEAVEAWTRAAAASTSRFAKRAAEHLAGRQPYRSR